MTTFMIELNKCLLLGNYFSAIWGLNAIKLENFGNSEIFNFDFVNAKV